MTVIEIICRVIGVVIGCAIVVAVIRETVNTDRKGK